MNYEENPRTCLKLINGLLFTYIQGEGRRKKKQMNGSLSKHKTLDEEGD